MTEHKAKKNAVRQRMAQTGERYNVARRSIETETTPASHLIGGEETQHIAERFLGASSWLGNVTWQNIVAGPGAGYLADFDGAFDPNVQLGDGQHWSWSVTFTDPSGQQKTLTHESVLDGVRGLVFGEDKTWSAGASRLRIQQWFTEPAVERRKLDLGASDSSRICQQALYGHQVFRTDDDNLGSKRLDFFSDQRPAQDEA